MTEATRATRRAPRSARRVGYVLGLALNLLILWLVTVEPGWRIVPILSEDFGEVVGLLIVSLLVGAAVNLVYLAADPRWLQHLGEALTAAIACVVLARMWSLFPIDLGGWNAWEPALRVVIGLACLGTGIGVVANLAQAIRIAVDTSPQDVDADLRCSTPPSPATPEVCCVGLAQAEDVRVDDVQGQ